MYIRVGKEMQTSAIPSHRHSPGSHELILRGAIFTVHVLDAAADGGIGVYPDVRRRSMVLHFLQRALHQSAAASFAGCSPFLILI